MRLRFGVAFLLLATLSCRTSMPGTPVAPLQAGTAEEALAELQRRVATFTGARSLMRVRATINGKTQSFRAQLVIPDRRSMELIAYTPIGTTAATIRASGERVEIVNHVENSAWEGSPEELARSLSIYATSMLPAEMAILLIGLPAVEGAAYETTPAGLSSASSDDVRVAYDPPAFPPRRVVVRRGADVVEVEHLEIVSTR